METVQGGMLLVYTLIAIVALIVMIAKFRIYPFLVLIIVSLGLALAVGMPMDGIVKSYEAGTGKTLGHLAIVIALGTMLGKMMAESGGAERIAITLIKWFGEKHIHWAMMFIALIVGLPVFFEVGFVLLIPIAFNIAKRTGKSLLIVGLPMVAGLSVVHGLIPPIQPLCLRYRLTMPTSVKPLCTVYWLASRQQLLQVHCMHYGLTNMSNCQKIIL